MRSDVSDVFERCVEITLVEMLLEKEPADLGRAQNMLLEKLLEGTGDVVLGAGYAFGDRVSSLWFDPGFVLPAIGFWSSHMASTLSFEFVCLLEESESSVFGVRLARMEAGEIQPVLLRQLFVSASLEVLGSQAGLKRAVGLALAAGHTIGKGA